MGLRMEPVAGPPLRFIEFLQALEHAGLHFIGHPARDEEAPVHGRWQDSSKGGEVLLVERSAAQAVFKSVDIEDPAEVLTLWKRAGVLYLAGRSVADSILAGLTRRATGFWPFGGTRSTAIGQRLWPDDDVRLRHGDLQRGCPRGKIIPPAP